MCVDPQFWLILVPSGSLWMTYVLRPQRVKNALCDGRSASVGTVKTNPDILKERVGSEDQITDITVPARRKVHRPSDIFFNGKWDLRRPVVDTIASIFASTSASIFCPIPLIILNSIIIERIMACEIIIPQSKFFGSHNIRYTSALS